MRLLLFPGVFKPHSDSLMLADQLRRESLPPDARVLDVCTGSGLLAIVAARRGAGRVVAVDISRRAVLATRFNARLNGVRVHARRGDLFRPVRGQQFDLILANPPYVPSVDAELPARGASRAWEAGPEGRAFVDRICVEAAPHLTDAGVLLLVHSSICSEQITLQALTSQGFDACIVARSRGPLGRRMRARAPTLRARGLLHGGDSEELVIIRAVRRPVCPGATAHRKTRASDAGDSRDTCHVGRLRLCAQVLGYKHCMRVVVIGGTGNAGTSVLEALGTEEAVEEIVAVARRAPLQAWPRITFVAADIARSDLVPVLRGADAVVHLAWLIQPGRDESVTYRVNVTGSERVFRAVVEAKVKTLVYASSVGVYSPGPKARPVDETWPTDGIPSSFYSRHKVAVERQLDRLEREQPGLRVIRARPALIFKAQAATEIRRLFAGPFLPGALLKPGLIPFVPDVARLRFQVVHSRDIGEAYRLALISDARGAFNFAADPPIGPIELAEIFRARRLKVPVGLLRIGAASTYVLRLQPTEPGWLDMGLAVPMMDSTRARAELGWHPRHDALDTLREQIDGLRAGSDAPTPPLQRGTSGPARVRELLTGVGTRP